LQGTGARLRSESQKAQHFAYHDDCKFHTFGFGYHENARYANIFCGLSISVLKARVRLQDVVEVGTPPFALLGRAGALHIRHDGLFDYWILCPYFPPKVSGKEGRKASQALFDCIKHKMYTSAQRSRFIWAMDLNAHLACYGLRDSVVGQWFNDTEDARGKQMHRLCRTFDLTLTNTRIKHASGPTWRGPISIGSSSRIDFLAISQDLWPRVSRVFLATRWAALLRDKDQMNSRGYDHVPICVDFRFRLWRKSVAFWWQMVLEYISEQHW
jgi:hypothetical protein